MSNDVIFRMENVKYKKSIGVLIVRKKNVGWNTPEDDTITVDVVYSDIRNTKISPESKPKVQLQLVLIDASSYLFNFSNPEGREKQVSDRDKAREKVAQLIKLSKHKPPDELLEKKRVLEENPHLKELYVALVQGKILSSEDFWKEIAGQYKKILPPQLDVGVSGAFLVDIKPQTDGSNGSVQYNITSEIMSSVFKTYPAVKRKHEEYVPHRLSETEFWNRFFQSHYYHAHTTIQSQNVFSECTKYDDKEWARDLNSIYNESLHNLKDIYDNRPLDVESDLNITSMKPGSNHIHATMIKRFNQHSQNIIKAQLDTEKERFCGEMMAKDPNTTVTEKNAHEFLNLGKSKKIKLSEKIGYTDLDRPSTSNKDSLVIHQKDRYLTGPTPEVAPDFRPAEVLAFSQRLNNSISKYEPDLFQTQTHGVAYRVTEHYAVECRRTRANNVGTRSGEVLPQNVQLKLSNIYSSSGELLRHFYACFPPRTPQLQEKLQRMHETLSKYHQCTVREFQELAVREYNCKSSLLDHLQHMFEIANTKYLNWRSRNR